MGDVNMEIPRVPIEGSHYFRAYCYVCKEPIRVTTIQIDEAEKDVLFTGFLCKDCEREPHPGYNPKTASTYNVAEGTWENIVREQEDQFDKDEVC
jgi:hypothetical protein